MLGVFCRIKAKSTKIEIQSIDALIIMRIYHPRSARCFTVFARKYGSLCYILLRRQPLCKLDAFLLLSINGDLRLTLTLADTGFHYCQRYFSKRTRYLGRFLELQCCATLSTPFKRVARNYTHTQDGQEARKAESSVCFLDFYRFFYFLATMKHFTAV